MREFVSPVSSSQKEVLDYLIKIPGGITFVHGKAGSGKTYLINRLSKQIKGCKVLTPTNLAASLYGNRGQTIHSFFWKGLDKLEEGINNPLNITDTKALGVAQDLQGIKMLVIDEVSMVRADLFEMMNQLCQKAKESYEPFGGIPLVIVGDLFQLPPIVSDEAIYKYLIKEYGGIYFFDSHVIKNNLSDIKLFELEQSFRQQNDPHFTSLLDNFRSPMTDEEKVKLLEEFNKRVTDQLPEDAVYIASSNKEVSEINARKLDALPGKASSIEAKYKIRLKDNSGHLDLAHTNLPIEEDIEDIVVPSAYDGVLSFKTGARVMLTKNAKVDGLRHYCNGDFGIIEDFDGTTFKIKLDNGQDILCPHPRDRYKDSQTRDYRYEYAYDESTHSFKKKSPFIQRTDQYPIKLAYAFTIHKSQGQTFKKVILDLNSHIFAPGQLYVALSRAKSLDSLFLTKKIIYSDIISDESIFIFLNEIRKANGGKPLKKEKETSDFIPSHKIHNPRCDDFISFVMIKEYNVTTKDFICNSLEGFKAVFALSEYELALQELIKIIDLVNDTYITDKYDSLIKTIHSKNPTSEDCKYNLNAIFEIYTDVVNSPRQQISIDNKYLPKTAV